VYVADKLETLRMEQPDYVSLSFDTISSIGANGAIIHYHPSTVYTATADCNHFTQKTGQQALIPRSCPI
jgi:Xaa-Pro aminopeptidase